MAIKPHYPEAYRPGTRSRPAAGESTALYPVIDLAGVPTITAKLHTAITANKRPTKKQREYNTQLIREACAEIIRRRAIAGERMYQQRLFDEEADADD